MTRELLLSSGDAGASAARPGHVLRAATRWRALPSLLGSARAGAGGGDPGLVLAPDDTRPAPGVGAGGGRPGHGRKGLACPRTPGRFRRRGLSTSDVTGVGRARGVQNRVAAVCSGQSAHAGPRGARWRPDAAQVRAPRGLAPFPAGLSQALRPRAPHISGDPDFSDGSPANTHARSVGGGGGRGRERCARWRFLCRLLRPQGGFSTVPLPGPRSVGIEKSTCPGLRC